MIGKITQIFPTPVGKYKLQEFFSKEQLDFVNKIESKTYRNHGNKTSIDTQILDNDIFKNIKKYCEDALNSFYKEVYLPELNSNIKIYITQSWLNYTYKNEFHHMHSHPNSFISGVLYIDADKNFDMITFTKPEHIYYDFDISSANDFNTNEVFFRVNTGDIVLFPSNLHHRVPNTTNPNKRISLAFNSFIKGNIGKKMSLNYLQL